jgi:enoyl-CoA hydratase
VLVDHERRGAVAILTLNRPDALNALSPELIEEMDGHLDRLEADEGVRAVVVTGAGERAFSAGADIAHMLDAAPLDALAFARRGQALMDRLEGFSRPVIAAVNGYALGGGCELALACDLRVAAESAVLGLPEVTLGIVPAWGGTQRLARLTSLGFAKEVVLTGRRVTAEEARMAGMVNHVHPVSHVLERAVALAEEIASHPPIAVAAAKALVTAAPDGHLAGGLARERDAFALSFTTEDRREGMAAFLEKRPPRFSGR